MSFAGEVEALLAQFPNWSENSDEQRRLRLSLYKPLLGLAADDRARIVKTTMDVLSKVART
jgi:type I restriction enzyme, R subunit